MAGLQKCHRQMSGELAFPQKTNSSLYVGAARPAATPGLLSEHPQPRRPSRRPERPRPVGCRRQDGGSAAAGCWDPRLGAAGAAPSPGAADPRGPSRGREAARPRLSPTWDPVSRVSQRGAAGAAPHLPSVWTADT